MEDQREQDSNFEGACNNNSAPAPPQNNSEGEDDAFSSASTIVPSSSISDASNSDESQSGLCKLTGVLISKKDPSSSHAQDELVTVTEDNNIPAGSTPEKSITSGNEAVVTMKRKKASDSPRCEDGVFHFVNKDARITPSALLQYVLDVDQPYDLIISCADGKLGAHRLVLAAASPFVGSMFDSFCHRLGEIATLILPDIRYPIMKILLNFCYTGTVVFAKEDEAEVIDAMRMLYLCEYATFTMSEVTVRPPPEEPEPEPAAVADPEPQPGPSSHCRVAMSCSHKANVPAKNKRIEEISLTSSSSDDESLEEDAVASDNESNSEAQDPSFSRSKGTPKIKKDVKEKRVNLPSDFLFSNKGQLTADDCAPYEYLIAPDCGTSQTPVFHCYYCVGVFKSLETLSAHLDKNHRICLDSSKVTKEDLKRLTFCETCSVIHDDISAVTRCLSKRSKTRCYLCLEVVKIAEFEQHVNEIHAIRKKGTKTVVKCRWCDAGIVVQAPIDHKVILNHCLSQHLEKGKIKLQPIFRVPEAKAPRKGTDEKGQSEGKEADLDTSFMSSSSSESLFYPNPITKKTKKSESTKPGDQVSTTPKPSLQNSSVENTPTNGHSNNTSTESTPTKKVPTVLAMLQRASLKRKRNEEEARKENDKPGIKKEKNSSESIKDKKRARLEIDSSPEFIKLHKPQVARRTGAPVGRNLYVNPDQLKEGVPKFKGFQLSKKDPNKSVRLDVTNLPQACVKLKYSRTFVSDAFHGKFSTSSDNDKDADGIENSSYTRSEGFRTAILDQGDVGEINVSHEEQRNVAVGEEGGPALDTGEGAGEESVINLSSSLDSID